jgi:hypothetical protein
MIKKRIKSRIKIESRIESFSYSLSCSSSSSYILIFLLLLLLFRAGRKLLGGRILHAGFPVVKRQMPIVDFQSQKG